MYTIMVVDDSSFIVDVFVTMLERGGYRTLATYGGQAVLRHIKAIALLSEEVCEQEPIFSGVIHQQDTRREVFNRGSVHGYIVA